MMILQGVRRQKPYNGVCYANDPKKEAYATLALALDLTTSLQGDLDQRGSLATTMVRTPLHRARKAVITVGSTVAGNQKKHSERVF